MSKTGMEKNEIMNITLRYHKSNNINFNRNIFLPYFIEDENKMFYLFKNYLILRKNFFS